ncbi:DUF4406 domain-containing protein (plasmid) [Vibrio metschnikovii]|uniref:DUF4406 domain-containing protein n=1 Tax=Vibrio metschnikovii TaxID=28172 RepID=UPI00315C6D2E
MMEANEPLLDAALRNAREAEVLASEIGKNKGIKFYIAGPVSGIDGKNRAAFKDAAELITSNGHIALYTQLLPDGLSEADYMKFAHAMLEVCDAVVLLPRWSLSVGAVAEYHWIEKLDKPVVRVEHMPAILRWTGSTQRRLIEQASNEVRAMVRGDDRLRWQLTAERGEYVEPAKTRVSITANK